MSSLDSHGISFSLDFTNDFVSSGGTRLAPMNSISFADWSGTLDLDRLTAGRSNGKVYFSFHKTDHLWAGSNGELQTISNADASPMNRLAELWFEKPLTSHASVRLGKIDANRDFSTIECASDFLNSSMGYSPTFFVLPNFNQTHWGGELLLTPARFSVRIATFLDDNDGTLAMGEVGGRWKVSGKNGRTAAGYWGSSGAFSTFSGNVLDRTSGSYVVVEQDLWKRQYAGNARILTGYAQYGSADPDLSMFSRQIGSGVVLQSPFSSRDHDSAGIGFSRGALTNVGNSHFEQGDETLLDGYYKLSVRAQVFVTADVQYFTHPGGAASPGHFVAFTARVHFLLTSHHE